MTTVFRSKSVIGILLKVKNEARFLDASRFCPL